MKAIFAAALVGASALAIDLRSHQPAFMFDDEGGYETNDLIPDKKEDKADAKTADELDIEAGLDALEAEVDANLNSAETDKDKDKDSEPATYGSTEETPAEETPAEDSTEETPAEDSAEEDSAEEDSTEETPAEETPAEETTAEETPAEDSDDADSADGDSMDEDDGYPELSLPKGNEDITKDVFDSIKSELNEPGLLLDLGEDDYDLDFPEEDPAYDYYDTLADMMDDDELDPYDIEFYDPYAQEEEEEEETQPAEEEPVEEEEEEEDETPAIATPVEIDDQTVRFYFDDLPEDPVDHDLIVTVNFEDNYVEFKKVPAKGE